MPKEIERKFLVKSLKFKELAKGKPYKQGYILNSEQTNIRIRLVKGRAFITIKSVDTGISRLEYEYEIPYPDGLDIIDKICLKPLIEKLRYKIKFKGFLWEVDEFQGDNLGLIVAEIELKYEEQKFELPDWIGEEVTYDVKYYNANLVLNPYKNWNN